MCAAFEAVIRVSYVAVTIDGILANFKDPTAPDGSVKVRCRGAGQS